MITRNDFIEFHIKDNILVGKLKTKVGIKHYKYNLRADKRLCNKQVITKKEYYNLVSMGK